MSDLSINPTSLSVARAFGDSKMNFMDLVPDEDECPGYLEPGAIGVCQVASDTDLQDLVIEIDIKEPVKRQRSTLVCCACEGFLLSRRSSARSNLAFYGGHTARPKQ
jgi:hypothetical protein